MAELLRDQFGADCKLEPGDTGEFTVWLGGVKIAEKTWEGFPSEGEILSRVKALPVQEVPPNGPPGS